MEKVKTSYTSGNNGIQEQYIATNKAGQQTPVFVTKRIGSTNYKVRVYFSNSSAETVEDKITRLIRDEIEKERELA